MTLTDLIEALEKATGPREELDTRIRYALFAPQDAYVQQSEINGAWCIFRGEWNGRPRIYERSREIPHSLWIGEYTRSVDAAIALAERVLPGWRICTEHGENYSIAQFKRGWGARTQILGVATAERADDEIALCLSAAILSALQAKEGNNG